MPVNEKRKISFNDVFRSNIEKANKIYKMFYDAAAGVNKKWGLERGDNINITGADTVPLKSTGNDSVNCVTNWRIR